MKYETKNNDENTKGTAAKNDDDTFRPGYVYGMYNQLAIQNTVNFPICHAHYLWLTNNTSKLVSKVIIA